MKVRIAIIAGFLIIGTHIPSSAENFGSNELWDDGLAEVAIYSAKKLTYGKLWDHEMVLVTVKEDFNKAYYTKADYPYDGKDLLPVLKLNIFTRVQTTIYPYHYLTSVFVKKDDITYPVKMTVSTQEWCGNTFKEWINWGKKTRMVYHSYFDGQGDGSVDVDYEPGDMLAEQLFVSLRSLPFKNGYSKKFRLCEPMMSNKFKKPVWHNASWRISGPEELTALDKKLTCWKVVVKTDAFTMTFWFSDEYPFSLIKYTDSHGQEMKVKELSRSAYWN